MVKSYLFKDVDSYDTPEGHPVSVWYRIFGRLYFYAINFHVFYKCGVAGRAGKLDGEVQTAQSSRNLHLVEKCGGKVHIRGIEHIRALNGRPCVLVANHMSLLETAMMHSIARGYIDFSFVIKESLSRLPYFKHIMSSLDAIAVGRTNPKEDLKKVLTEGKRILTEGRSIVIFPQHTRTEDFIPENFNTIGIKLAKSAGVPVVPLALKTDFTKNGRIIRDMGAICPEHEVWYEFGPAVEIEGNGHEQHRKIVEFIKSRVDSWKAAEGR